MAKTTIRMQVRSQELWGSEGNVIESMNLGIPNNGGSSFDAPTPNHNISLFFPQGEGFSRFPMGSEMDVTFEPVKTEG